MAMARNCKNISHLQGDFTCSTQQALRNGEDFSCFTEGKTKAQSSSLTQRPNSPCLFQDVVFQGGGGFWSCCGNRTAKLRSLGYFQEGEQAGPSGTASVRAGGTFVRMEPLNGVVTWENHIWIQAALGQAVPGTVWRCLHPFRNCFCRWVSSSECGAQSQTCFLAQKKNLPFSCSPQTLHPFPPPLFDTYFVLLHRKDAFS